jgi:hypothetical protein
VPNNSRFTFSFEGIPGFLDALERATAPVRERVRDLMRETAHDVRDTARQNVPQDEGDLADEIIVVEGRGRGGMSFTIGISDAVVTRRGSNRIHQRPFIYGAIIERGSRFNGPEPFMRRSADFHLARFQTRLGQVGLVI